MTSVPQASALTAATLAAVKFASRTMPTTKRIAPTARTPDPINLSRWIDANQHLLKPPVGNQYMYCGEDFIVMVIGGPNTRNDFHVNTTEEWFHQIKGDIAVRVREGERMRDVVIREGETWLCPALLPHRPQRPAGTVGLVVEAQRPPGDLDHLVFYCEKCDALVHDAAFQMEDIVVHFARIMEEYWSGPVEARTCRACGTVVEKAGPYEMKNLRC
ncbi:MAG TPA: 3-hydroxyanthranilate 3,4-dioxygenase [Phycisphaerales bacterium]|nr:3-hydroxyanthranilate 3,4-dioxygenase [Phycisphaerales bacterium]HMP38539.1 3-hydroxyanthranilate 3,4-dioxygenase [Phycisphaerales bacterium]